VGGPLAGAAAPAELRGAGAMVDAGGPVPGHAPVPLHVRVEREEFAVGVEGHVVGVAEAGQDQLPLLALGVGAEDVAAGGQDAGGVAVTVPLPGQELVLPEVAVRGGRLQAR